MIDKIYKNNSESYKYVKNYNNRNSWDSTQRSSFENVIKATADNFSMSDKSKIQNSYSEFLNAIGADVNSENMQAVKSVESRLQYFANAKADDVNYVAKMGFDLGKSDDMTVYGQMQEMREEEKEDEDTVSTSIQEYAEKHPEIYNDIRLFKIAKALFANGMTVNDYNVDKLVSVGDMLAKTGRIGEKEIVNFFKGNGVASAEEICVAKHTGGENNDKLLSDEEVESLMPEIEKLFEREGIEKSDENIKNARLFLKNEIAVSKENIEKADFLMNADFTDLYDSLAKAEARGEDCLKADLYEIGKVTKDAQKRLYENYIKVSENIKKIDVSILQKMYESGTEYTLKNISDMASGYVAENLNTDDLQISNEVVTAKRKITEIQLRMTNEAMLRLSGKGIDITTEHIENALETLKKTENEINAEILEKVGVKASAENLQTMELATKVKNSLANVSVMNIFENAVKNSMVVNFKNISSTFQALELEPSAKYGDKLPYNEQQLTNLLETNGFEATNENIKVAEIISRNKMDLTEENMLAIKTINLKFEKIYNKLHPVTVAQMIKDGINPLEISLDDMLEYIDNFGEKYGQTSKEKIAEYIIEAENLGELTQDEKKAVIAIYRAMNITESYGSASMGLSSESTSNITMGKLLSAAKAFAKTKKEGFENVIDDNFGMLEEIKTDDENIQSTLANAVSNLNEREKAVSEYMDLLIERLIDVSAPNELITLMREKSQFNEMALENIYNGLKKIAKEQDDLFISKEKAESLAEKVRNMSDAGKEPLKWLTENNIPLTVNNISSMAKLIADSFKSGNELNKLDKEERKKGRDGINIEEIDKAEIENEDIFAEISQNVVEEINNIYEEVVFAEHSEDIGDMLTRLKELGIDIELQRKLNSNKDGAYQIPIRLSDGNITNLNIYAINNNIDNDGTFKGFMNLQTENLNTVGAYIAVKENSVSVKVKAETEQNKNLLLQDREELEQMFLNAGFENISVEFICDEKKENIFEENFEKNIEENAPQIDADVNVLV